MNLLFYYYYIIYESIIFHDLQHSEVGSHEVGLAAKKVVFLQQFHRCFHHFDSAAIFDWKLLKSLKRQGVNTVTWLNLRFLSE